VGAGSGSAAVTNGLRSRRRRRRESVGDTRHNFLKSRIGREEASGVDVGRRRGFGGRAVGEVEARE
jgi:hypothetical protein